MPFYRLRRHVVYRPGCQQTMEVWGIDRPAPGLHVVCAPRDTDADDPLGGDDCCGRYLLTICGEWVTWGRIWEWLSVAEEAGYSVVSGYEKLSPYSVIILKGPVPGSSSAS